MSEESVSNNSRRSQIWTWRFTFA